MKNFNGLREPTFIEGQFFSALHDVALPVPLPRTLLVTDPSAVLIQKDSGRARPVRPVYVRQFTPKHGRPRKVRASLCDRLALLGEMALDEHRTWGKALVNANESPVWLLGSGALAADHFARHFVVRRQTVPLDPVGLGWRIASRDEPEHEERSEAGSDDEDPQLDPIPSLRRQPEWRLGLTKPGLVAVARERWALLAHRQRRVSALPGITRF